LGLNSGEGGNGMASFNKVLLMGNLTRDIEMRSLPSGQVVGSFGLAMNRVFTTQDGQKREEVTFVDCEVWGKAAETMHKYLSKGRPVLIDGRLKLDSWEDKDGAKKSKLKVVVEEFRFVGARDGAPAGGGGGGGAPTIETQGMGMDEGSGYNRSSGRSSDVSPVGGHVSVPEDDIPF